MYKKKNSGTKMYDKVKKKLSRDESRLFIEYIKKN